ncbi:MAG: ABC transporter permease [Thermoanaerobaculia bacterium]
MRLTAAFAAHELRTQGRSLRFRVVAALYAVLGAGPAALCWARREQTLSVIGSSTYAAETFQILPVLTAVAAFLLSLDAITREQDEGAWSTVSLAGMSSAGYLLRRWFSLQALLLPLTALPVAAAAALAMAANGPENLYPAAFGIPWLLHLVPIALTFSALAVAAGTIAGGAINAFLLAAFVLFFLPPLIDALAGPWRIRLGSPLGWLDMGYLPRSLGRAFGDTQHDTFLSLPFPLAVSELPFDPGPVAGQILARAAVPVALAALLLGLAARYLRRTRPDVRPWRIRRDHPLRTFLLLLARLRERYTPDPRPARTDLLILGALLLLAAGVSALAIGRVRYFEALGRARFEAERSQTPAPTPGDLLPGRWRVEGRLGPGRSVDLTVASEMRNLGPAPRGHLAFTLNPSLGIAGTSAGEGTLRLSRTWDRLAVELDPPIPPGGRREIRFHLTGAPAEVRISPQIFEYPPFHKRFGDHLRPRFFRELLELNTSVEAPALSARRIRLVAADLSPIPRYQPWKLDEDLNLLEESFTPQANVAVSLAGPRGVLLADSCGDTARSGRLAGGCRIPLAELAVMGGRYVTLPSTETGTTVAVYPAHARVGELHLGFFNGSVRKAEEAWPGLEGLQRIAVIEWSGNRIFDPDPIGTAMATRWRGPNDLAFTTLGNLVLLSEGDLILRNKVLKPESFLAEVVAAQLIRRRALAPKDSVFFRFLLRNLALQRLGLGPDSGAAVMGLKPGQGGAIRVPPPEDFYGTIYWHSRFPALLVGLRHLMGEEKLRQAVEELLSQNVQQPCTREELVEVLARHGGADAARFLAENLVKGGLAEPVLEGVELRQTADGWHATGKVHNRGDAEALCKVVLTTDLGPVSAMVRAEGEKDGAFDLHTTRRPQAVLLDPDRECHRLVPSAAPGDRVFFQGSK